jgi:hypothetical protein
MAASEFLEDVSHISGPSELPCCLCFLFVFLVSLVVTLSFLDSSNNLLKPFVGGDM